jgi:very-short-patch-repair endonuclease
MGEVGGGGYLNSGLIANNAKRLRKNLTAAERLLWKYLRAKQLNGIKFRRQEPIGKYIVDFVFFEKKIVVEIDGGQHSEQQAKDAERDLWLRSQGFLVLRFWNHEVMQHADSVVARIAECALKHPPQPLPSREA